MTTIDLVIVIVLAVGAIVGFMKGFIRQIVSMVGLIAGLLVARALFGVVGEKLAAEAGMSVTFGQILAFILIGVVVPVGLSVAASILTKVASAVHLSFLNRCYIIRWKGFPTCSILRSRLWPKNLLKIQIRTNPVMIFDNINSDNSNNNLICN